VLPAEYISLFDNTRSRGSRLSTLPTIVTDDVQNGGSTGREWRTKSRVDISAATMIGPFSG